MFNWLESVNSPSCYSTSYSTSCGLFKSTLDTAFFLSEGHFSTKNGVEWACSLPRFEWYPTSLELDLVRNSGGSLLCSDSSGILVFSRTGIPLVPLSSMKSVYGDSETAGSRDSFRAISSNTLLLDTLNKNSNKMDYNWEQVSYLNGFCLVVGL